MFLGFQRGVTGSHLGSFTVFTSKNPGAFIVVCFRKHPAYALAFLLKPQTC